MPFCEINALPAQIRPSSCLLGLDVGTKTIGLAVCDPGLVVASPLNTIIRRKFTPDAQELGRVIKDRNIGGLVVGLPRNMDGSEGPRAQSVRQFAANLLAQSPLIGGDLPIAFWDERLSTAAVERFLLEDDTSRARRDEVVDKMAAAYILQGALDALAFVRRRQQRQDAP